MEAIKAGFLGGGAGAAAMLKDSRPHSRLWLQR